MNTLKYEVGGSLIAEFRVLDNYDLLSIKGFAETASREYPEQYGLLLTAFTLYTSMIDCPIKHDDGELFFPFETRPLDQTKHIPMTFDNFAQLYIDYSVQIEGFHDVMSKGLLITHPEFIRIFREHIPESKGDDP